MPVQTIAPEDLEDTPFTLQHERSESTTEQEGSQLSSQDGLQAEDTDHAPRAASVNYAVQDWLDNNESTLLQLDTHVAQPTKTAEVQEQQQQHGAVSGLVKQYEQLGSAHGRSTVHTVADPLTEPSLSSVTPLRLKSALLKKFNLPSAAFKAAAAKVRREGLTAASTSPGAEMHFSEMALQAAGQGRPEQLAAVAASSGDATQQSKVPSEAGRSVAHSLRHEEALAIEHSEAGRATECRDEALLTTQHNELPHEQGRGASHTDEALLAAQHNAMPLGHGKTAGPGLAARHEAALAAHKARLHLKAQHKAQSGQRASASQQSAQHAMPQHSSLKTAATPAVAKSDTSSSSHSVVDLAPERSSLSSVWASLMRHGPQNRVADLSTASSAASKLEASRSTSVDQALIRQGTAAAVSVNGLVAASSRSQPALASPKSAPPPVTIADIMRQGSVTAETVHSGVSPSSASPRPRRQAAAMTVADIMRQNSKLPPLEPAPVSPSRRSSLAASPMKRALALAAGNLAGTRRQPSRGLAVAAAAAVSAAEIGQDAAALSDSDMSHWAGLDSGSPGYGSDPSTGKPSLNPPMTPRRVKIVLPLMSSRASGMSPDSVVATPRPSNK